MKKVDKKYRCGILASWIAFCVSAGQSMAQGFVRVKLHPKPEKLCRSSVEHSWICVDK